MTMVNKFTQIITELFKFAYSDSVTSHIWMMDPNTEWYIYKLIVVKLGRFCSLKSYELQVNQILCQ